MCEYCYKRDDGEIMGRTIRTNDLKKTAGCEPPKNKNDFLEMFILKLKNDKKAGLMIDNGYGYRYIDINYCPMCRKEAGKIMIKEFCDICKVEINKNDVLNSVNTPSKNLKICNDCLKDLIEYLENRSNNFKVETTRYERDYRIWQRRTNMDGRTY